MGVHGGNLKNSPAISCGFCEARDPVFRKNPPVTMRSHQHVRPCGSGAGRKPGLEGNGQGTREANLKESLSLSAGTYALSLGGICHGNRKILPPVFTYFQVIPVHFRGPLPQKRNRAYRISSRPPASPTNSLRHGLPCRILRAPGSTAPVWRRSPSTPRRVPRSRPPPCPRRPRD